MAIALSGDSAIDLTNPSKIDGLVILHRTKHFTKCLQCIFGLIEVKRKRMSLKATS
jgi:hypothetical protein